MKNVFSEWLEAELQERSWNNAALARHLQISPSLVSNWINGSTWPGTYNIQRLAEILDAEPKEITELISRSKGQRMATAWPSAPPEPQPVYDLRKAADIVQLIAKEMVMLPIGDISAGPGVAGDTVFYLPRSLVGNHRVIGYRVRGQSMEPEIPDGAIVAVDLERIAQPGDIVVAWTPQGGVVKRLRRRDGELELAGNDHAAIPLSEDVRIEGVVFSVTRFM